MAPPVRRRPGGERRGCHRRALGVGGGPVPRSAPRTADDRRCRRRAGHPASGPRVPGGRRGAGRAAARRALRRSPAGGRGGLRSLAEPCQTGGSGTSVGHFPCLTTVLKRYPRNFSEESRLRTGKPKTLVPQRFLPSDSATFLATPRNGCLTNPRLWVLIPR